MEAHDVLGLARKAWEDLSEHFVSRTFRGRSYQHLPDYRSGLERGTVLIGETAVRGFPKIPRTLVLEAGIPRQFDESITVEEKLNGYNVRVADVGDIIAFTRSGIACPFTTHWVREQLELTPFFRDHQEVMLCGELVGPENPYTAHDYAAVESLAFRAFDIRQRTTGTPLPVDDRRAICERYDVPQVRTFGEYDAADASAAVTEIIDELDAAGREGVVMKSADGTTQLKYTTAAANRGDLEYAFSLPFDYGQAFMFRRLLREAFQAVEREEDATALTERAHELGEVILLPMVGTIRDVDAGESVGERHRVRGDPEAIADLLAHLRDMDLELEIESDETTAGERVVSFIKVSRKTMDSTDAYLDGRIVTE